MRAAQEQGRCGKSYHKCGPVVRRKRLKRGKGSEACWYMRAVVSTMQGGGGGGLGNVALRLWCGERKLELFRRAGPGEEARVERQVVRNGVFGGVVGEMRAKVLHE